MTNNQSALPYTDASTSTDRIMQIELELERIGYVIEPRPVWKRILFNILGMIAIICWIGLFVLGSWIDTKPHRECLMDEGFRWKEFGPVFWCWTPSNVAFLGLLAAFAAGCLSYNFNPRALKARIIDSRLSGDEDTAAKLLRRIEFMHEVPWVSMKRGFVVFLTIIGGVFVLDTNPFGETTPAQAQATYVKLAGIVSSLAFLVGYDPTRFEGLINMISSSAAGRITRPQGEENTRWHDGDRDGDQHREDHEGEQTDPATVPPAGEEDPFGKPVRAL